ncbi:MAG: hypothetical protein AB7R00_04930 [Kofleriaceae bacterium]
MRFIRVRFAIVGLIACLPLHTSAQPARAGARSATPATTLIAARVAAAVDGGPATDRAAYARIDQPVILYAVIELEIGGRKRLFSDAPALRLAGKTVAAEPLANAPPIGLAWHRIEPVAANYSNGDGPTFHYEPIGYRATPIGDSAGQPSLRADVRPTLTTDYGSGVGTMRYQVVATLGGRSVASAGVDARRAGASGGLTDAVLRVSIRKDDSYLGYLTEMFGQPYVWASAGRSDATHQSERLEGSDCADFVIYGIRRMGKKLAYTWSGGLPNVTNLLASGTRHDDGVYRDRTDRPVPFTKVGDVVLFPRHVGVLVEDRGQHGILDDQDIMMHTLFDSPRAQPIADTGYANRPLELRRFR